MSAGLGPALGAAVGGEVAALAPVAGGDLNLAFRARMADGRELFVKTRAGASAQEYAAEAAGLAWLGRPGELPVPGVVAVGAGEPAFLALDWIEQGSRGPGFDAELGRGLALLHAAGAPAHGATPDGGPVRLGPLVLDGAPGPSWPEFYGRARLEPMARLAASRGALPDGFEAGLERLLGRLDDLAGPPEPPARLHGDLWSGNVLAGADGRPWLIDPAAHGGHREMDLAMLSLFGAPGPALLDAYEEVAPLAEGHEDRVALWQLFPLLVHAALFGGGYGASAARCLAAVA